MVDPYLAFLEKAEENLAAAQSELANSRYNSCANRAYYACFQAAIFALERAGIRPIDDRTWNHNFVIAQFVGQLVNRRKLYPANVAGTLDQNRALRRIADYNTQHVTATRAERTVRRTVVFLAAIKQRTGERQ